MIKLADFNGLTILFIKVNNIDLFIFVFCVFWY